MFRSLSKLFNTPLLSYVESNYRYPGFPSIYYQKGPQVLFDMPRRLEPDEDLPIGCIIKNTHRYPLELQSIHIRTDGGKVLYEETCNIKIDALFYHHLCLIPRALLEVYAGNPLDIVPEAMLKCKHKVRHVRIHNYKQLSRLPLKVYIAREKLPGSEKYLWSDLHTHSTHTHNQMEFGAPVPLIARFSKAFGISAASVTDHSFDLDDATGAFHQPDPSLPRWHALNKEINAEKDLIFIPGEELSCSNEKHKNVHLLVYDHPDFIYGDDDNSSGKAGRRPKLLYNDVYEKLQKGASVYAAHAAEKAPLPHRLFLRRGNWHIPSTRDVHGFQLFNGMIDRHVRSSLQLWTGNLLRGWKQFLIAGNDTHGNFNRLQHVKIPNFLLSEDHKYYYGRQRTGLLDAHDRESASDALRKGRMIVSNSYALECRLINEQGERFILGDHAKGKTFEICVKATSNDEYGPFKELRVWYGDLRERKEQLIYSSGKMRYELEETVSFSPPGPGYIRAEVLDRPFVWKRFAFSNPIWVNQDKSKK
jgi:hypothetical protein